MRLSDQQLIPRDIQTTWRALNDMALIQRCIPGCDSIVPEGENKYGIVLVAAVGPVKARFRGTIEFAEIVSPTSYVIHFEGSGGVAGFARGSARISLSAIDTAQTQLSYIVESEIGGKLAQIGSRLVDSTAGKLSGKFFDTFKKEMEGSASLTNTAATALASPRPPLAEPVTAAAAVAAAGQDAFHRRGSTIAERVIVEVSLKGSGFLAITAIVSAIAGYLLGTR